MKSVYRIFIGVLLGTILISCSSGGKETTKPATAGIQSQENNQDLKSGVKSDVQPGGTASSTVQPRTTKEEPQQDSTVQSRPSDGRETTPVVTAQQPALAQSASTSGEPAPVEIDQIASTQATPVQATQDTPAQAASAQSAPAQVESTAANPVSNVTLSVDGGKTRGIILAVQTVGIKQGDTVLDVLSRTMKEQKIQLEYSGGKGMAYVKGIDNLYEFDEGPKSGWMFKVNGKASDRSAGAFAVKPGDTIEWMYTLDLGKDIGAK